MPRFSKVFRNLFAGDKNKDKKETFKNIQRDIDQFIENIPNLFQEIELPDNSPQIPDNRVQYKPAVTQPQHTEDNSQLQIFETEYVTAQGSTSATTQPSNSAAAPRAPRGRPPLSRTALKAPCSRKSVRKDTPECRDKRARNNGR